MALLWICLALVAVGLVAAGARGLHRARMPEDQQTVAAHHRRLRHNQWQDLVDR